MRVSCMEPFGVKIQGLDSGDLMSLPVKEIEGYLRDAGLVLFENIHLSAPQLKDFCSQFSELESTVPEKSEEGTDGVLRVTSQVDRNGRPLGIFGHSSELGWHANRPSSRDRKSIVATYSSEGCDGTETWWANTRMAFEKMDEKVQSKLRGMKGQFGYRAGTYTEENYKPHKNEEYWPLVFERFGKETLYFPFHQIVCFENRWGENVEDINPFVEFVLRPDFIYKHRWSGHQLILSDQWTTIHCRPECRMEGRKILRTSFNYSNDVFPF